MQELVREYLNDLGKKNKKRRQLRVIVVVFALIVVGGVIWGLSRAGIATTGEAKCGREEHQHTDECYSDVLSCGMEEGGGHLHTDACYQMAEPALICGMEESEEHAHTDACYQPGEMILICGQEEYEGHTHSEACYTKQLACGKEEHQHEDDCYIDRSADVEDASKWNAQYENIEWENEWGKDLVTAAKLQLDYKESAANYTVAADGSHKGYTRYGQFNGDPYKDWDASFVNFCMYYAGLKSSNMFPDEKDTAEWYDKFVKDDEGKKRVYLTTPEGYEPQEGDVIFLKKENEETEFQMGIVSSYNEEDKEKNEFKVIEGNSDNQVKENTYKIDDEHIFEYLKITEMEKAYKEAQAEPEQPADETEAQVPEEAIIEISTEVDGVTITLYGPESSFEAGREYTIQAKKVEDEEVLETVGEAVEQVAEEKEKKVENYQPYDIKLLADGEEVQPLGPVWVKFSGQGVVEAVENEATEVNVFHMDEETGKAKDMGATTTDEKEVVIETEHFSVYVYVNLSDIFGKINVTVEHWGENITVVDGTAIATGTDTAFQTGNNPYVKTKTQNCEIYSADELEIPNEYYGSVEKLSKICNVGEEKVRYDVSKVWVCDPEKADTYKGQKTKTWKKGDYEEYTLSDIKQIKLAEDSLIRFWYTPKKADNQLPTPANFYDYDITDGTVTKYGSVKTKGTFRLRETAPSGTVLGTPAACWAPILEAPKEYSDGYYWYKINCNGTIGYMRSDGLTVEENYANQNYVKSEEKGINASENFSTTSTADRMGVGQESSGNLSSWALTANKNGKNLNKVGVVKGLVKDSLNNGSLEYNVTVPKTGYFAPGIGSEEYAGIYQVRFKQDGDTYTLDNVYNTETETEVAENLAQFSRYDSFNSSYPSGLFMSGTWRTPTYSNNFWPMDDVKGADPHMGVSLKQYRFLYNNGSELQKIDGPNPSDDNIQHNWHFGMTYTIEFTIGDYTGPMEYYFRGDDDFWLYIDGQLAVDIGGIHSSAGETLDVRDWMQKKGILSDKEQKHTMKIFYMERGGFGSCCYMQFTLPNSEPVSLPESSKTKYSVEKDWDDNDNPYRPDSVTIELLQDGKTTGATVDLSEDNEWKHEWDGLPEIEGATGKLHYYSYTVREINVPEGYTPTLSPDGKLTNTLNSVKVKVKKEWENDDGVEDDYRLGSVEMQLYADGVPYIDKSDNPKTIILDSINSWEGEFVDLPEFRYELVSASENSLELNSNKNKIRAVPIKYTVVEKGENAGYISGKNGAQYVVTYTEADSVSLGSDYVASLIVTNTLRTKFKIIKTGGTDEENRSVPLSGAKFSLTPRKVESSGTDNGESGQAATLGVQPSKIKWDPEPKYFGDSGEDGVLTWTVSKDGNEIDAKLIEPGIYLFQEIIAPAGFKLSNEKWIIDIGTEGKAVLQKENVTSQGEDSTLQEVECTVENGEVLFTYTFHDEALYELPSTGGPGIYWYMFSGVLLMAAASLITYRNKRREVLRS